MLYAALDFEFFFLTKTTDERSESESVNEDSSDNTIGGQNNITTSHDIPISALPLSRLAGKNLTSVPDMRTCKDSQFCIKFPGFFC